MVGPSKLCSLASGSKEVLVLSQRGLPSTHLPKGDVKAVLGIEASLRGMWWYPAHRSKVEKYFVPFNCENISSTLGMGQTNFLITSFRAFGATMMGADQLE